MSTFYLAISNSSFCVSTYNFLNHTVILLISLQPEFSDYFRNVTLKVPKSKGILFETTIIECYHRNECSVKEVFIEMYLAEISVYRVEDVTGSFMQNQSISPGALAI